MLDQEIMLAAVGNLTKRIKERSKQKIVVKTAPLTLPNVINEPPAFHHGAIQALYNAFWILYDNEIAEVMTLPA